MIEETNGMEYPMISLVLPITRLLPIVKRSEEEGNQEENCNMKTSQLQQQFVCDRNFDHGGRRRHS